MHLVELGQVVGLRDLEEVVPEDVAQQVELEDLDGVE